MQFNSIPITIRTPGTYIEVDNSKAIQGLAQLEKRVLMIGQMLAAGTATALVPIPVFSVAQAAALFGEGSFLHNMYKALRANSQNLPVYVIPIADAGGGTQAAGAIAFAGSTPTENGTLFLYIAGELVPVAIAKTDTAANIATATAAAINANTTLPVTAAVDGVVTSKVNITCRHKGTLGNGIDIRFNFYGQVGGEKTPAGIAAVITAMTGGATDPTMSTAISAIPEEIYDYIVFPYTDSTSMTALETEMNTRWSGTVMLDGHVFTAKKDTVSNLSTFGNTRNNQHVSCIGFNDSPTPAYEWAAALCGQVGESASAAPARPFTTLPLNGVKVDPSAAFIQTERNTLLYDGIATFTVTRYNVVQIERVVTMYQLNATSSPDASYLDANTLLQLSEISQQLRIRIATKYQRYALADNGTPIRRGMYIVTPNDIRAEIIAHFMELQDAGLVENLDSFKSLIVVERDATDRNRVNAQLPYDLINQLLIFAGQIQFRL